MDIDYTASIKGLGDRLILVFLKQMQLWSWDIVTEELKYDPKMIQTILKVWTT